MKRKYCPTSLVITSYSIYVLMSLKLVFTIHWS